MEGRAAMRGVCQGIWPPDGTGKVQLGNCPARTWAVGECTLVCKGLSWVCDRPLHAAVLKLAWCFTLQQTCSMVSPSTT